MRGCGSAKEQGQAAAAPRPRRAMPQTSLTLAGAARLLGVSDGLVGEEGEAVTDGLGIDEAHGLLVAGLSEEALARPEHDREDDQPQLVYQVVLDQRAPELIAGWDNDFSA